MLSLVTPLLYNYYRPRQVETLEISEIFSFMIGGKLAYLSGNGSIKKLSGLK